MILFARKCICFHFYYYIGLHICGKHSFICDYEPSFLAAVPENPTQHAVCMSVESTSLSCYMSVKYCSLTQYTNSNFPLEYVGQLGPNAYY